jgi:D-alanyl-D-alanine carboxypeptidase
MALALFLTLVPVVGLAAPYAAYVIDARTGEVLYETNANTRLHPASLTKMMTLYITFEAIERGEISLDTMVTVSKYAASQAPSKLGLKAGQKIAVRYLIRAAAIKSANDAATALCETVGGSEAQFARRMNRTAKAIGMTRSSFKNCNGLTVSGHLSTAHDMTMLGRHLFYDFPQYYNIFSRRTADAGVAQVASTNRRFLDSYEGADGIKTGYTGPAGFNLTASAQRGGKRIIATILGGQSTAQRNSKMAELLDVGFGKAPDKATIQKPEAPTYVAEADAPQSEDQVAAAVAVDVAIIEGGTEANVASGKTIRLNLAVAKSRRPVARPGSAPAEPALVADAGIAPDTAAASADDTQVAMSDGIDAALAEAHEDPGPAFDQSTSAQPETLAMADATDAVQPVTPADTAALSDAIAAEASDGTVEIAAADSLIAPIDPDVTVGTAATDPLVMATAGPAPVAVNAASAFALLTPPLPRPSRNILAETAAAAPADETVVLASLSSQPATEPSADQIVLEAAPPVDITDEDLQVVTRISTSGGRQWAINVGNFNTRYDAERQLLQTALAEMNTLDEALRKVVNRKGGFDANFVGMTQDKAELACRRLAARNTECSVIGPQG